MEQGLAKLAAIICCKGDSSASPQPWIIIGKKVLQFDGREGDDVEVIERHLIENTLEKSTPMSLNAEGEINQLIRRVTGGSDLGIFRYPILRIMRDWEQIKIKELEVEKKDIDSSITTVKNEVYQLGGLYTVFIGVLFTAVSTSSKLECRHIWSPIVLCCMGFLMMAFIAHKKFKFLEDTHVTRTLPNFLQRKVISYCVNKAKLIPSDQLGVGDDTFEVAQEPYHGLPKETYIFHSGLPKEAYIFRDEVLAAELYLKFLSQQDVLDEGHPARLTWPVGRVKCPKGAKPVDRAPRYIVITILAAATAVLVVSFVHILCL